MKTAGGYTSSGRKKPVTLKEAHAAYRADWQTRQALMDELDEDGFPPMSCIWEDILKAMRDRLETKGGNE